MAVVLDMTNVTNGLPNKFSTSISCGIDYSRLGMSEPSASRLRRMYEVPDVAEIRLNFRL